MTIDMLSINDYNNGDSHSTNKSSATITPTTNHTTVATLNRNRSRSIYGNSSGSIGAMPSTLLATFSGRSSHSIV